MEKKKLEDYSMEELARNKKVLTGILFIMGTLIVLYVAFFVYKFLAGTWDRNNTLGIVAIGMLVVVISINTARLGAINAELKRREQV